MAKEIRLAVTQSYFDADGKVVYDVGQEFPLGADLPPDLRTCEFVADVPDVPDAPAPKKTAAKA